MGFHNICSKCDQALVAYLLSRNAGTAEDILPGKGSQQKAVPCTICWTHTAKPPDDFPFAGLYLAEAFIEIRTSGVQEVTESDPDQPRLDSDERVSQTIDAFQINGENDGEVLGAAITQAALGVVSDFGALSCKIVEVNYGFNPRAAAQQGNCWVDTIHLEILCGPNSEIAPPTSLTL